MTTMDDERCRGRVYSDAGFHYHQCGNKPNKRLGTGYCKIHDPDTIKAKRAVREAEWNKRWKEKQRGWERNRRQIEAKEKAITLCRDIKEGVCSMTGVSLASINSTSGLVTIRSRAEKIIEQYDCV